MPRSDRERNRRQPIKGRKPSKNKQQPNIEIPKEDISIAVQQLKRGHIILYPSDTLYALGCDATKYDAVEKLRELKSIPVDEGFILLVDSFKMLEQYVDEIPDMAWEVLKHNKKPLTIVYDKPKGMAENCIAADGSIAIRVTNDSISKSIIRSLRKPIISTAACRSDEKKPLGFYDIEDSLKNQIDHIVELPLLIKNPKPSSIIKLSNNGIMKILRK